MSDNRHISISKLLTKTTLNNLISDFVGKLDVTDSSKAEYRKSLHQFGAWLQKSKPTEIPPGYLLGYKQYLEISGKKPLTITGYLNPARTFLKWAGYPEAGEGVHIKRDKGFRKDPLTVNQIDELLQVFDRRSIKGKRDYAIINLMINTGLRTNEVRLANIKDIRQIGGQAVLYVMGKGCKEKNEFVVLTPASQNPINDYLLARKEKSEQPLFASQKSIKNECRLSTRSIRRIVKEYLLKIGLKSSRLTAHSLRHTAVTLALLGGASLQEAMAMARHSSIQTTMIYSHNIDRIGAAAEKKVARFLRKAR